MRSVLVILLAFWGAWVPACALARPVGAQLAAQVPAQTTAPATVQTSRHPIAPAFTVGQVIIRARYGSAPIPLVHVSSEGLVTETDSRGEARLSLAPGHHRVACSHVGFAADTTEVLIRSGADTTVTVRLRVQAYDSEVIVVSATRSGTIVKDQPTRVETVPQEEIEENLTVSPGTLSTLLEEMAGVHLQESAPGLGGSSLRLQGLPGRYTEILSDGLPLYGGQIDPFSILQVPPLDLAHVEVIKGTASALYGGSALGGIVNLVSRHPDGEPGVIASQTSRGGSDGYAFVPLKLGGLWGCTLLGGADRQVETDVDGDGWADLPGVRRLVLRPRVFRGEGTGRSIFATVGTTFERRTAGTTGGGTTPDGTFFREGLDTQRLDGGAVGRFLVGGDRLVTVRASYTRTRSDLTFGGAFERDLRQFVFSEATLNGSGGGHTWVAGAGFQRDGFRSHPFPAFDYTNSAPALFAQDEYAPSRRIAVSASGRVDFHNRIGTVFHPRVSLLVRPGEEWIVRASAGTGSSAPTPLTEKTEVVGLSRLVPTAGLKAERAHSGSLDASWLHGAMELNGSVFASEVVDALALRTATSPLRTATDILRTGAGPVPAQAEAVPADAGHIRIVNAPSPSRIVGTEFLARFTRGALHVIATETELHATEADPAGGRHETPLTPRRSAELAGILESEQRGRIGVELSYTGRQHLEENPYRSTGAAYLEVNALGEIRFGHVGVFVNGINLGDVRQSRYQRMALPARTPAGEWTSEGWAPVEGRVVNVGVRVEM
jgi:outer membrane receptor for ferrienterochelin and colicins